MLVDALSVTFRALSFVALFQAAGVAMFVAIFGRELMSTESTVRRIGAISAILAIVLVLGHYVLEAGRMAGELAGVSDATLQGMVLHSPASVALAWREVGLLLVALGLMNGSTRGTTLALLGATLAIVAFTHLGHTATHSERWLLGVLLLLHLLVVAFWFGALWPLYLATAREVPATAARLVEGFSTLALWLVPGLFIAGLVLGALILGNFAALATTYAHFLIWKVTLFGLLMLLASLNKWRLGPALHGERAASAAIAFRRSVLVEYLLIVAILALTATLTSFYSPEE